MRIKQLPQLLPNPACAFRGPSVSVGPGEWVWGFEKASEPAQGRHWNKGGKNEISFPIDLTQAIDLPAPSSLPVNPVQMS